MNKKISLLLIFALALTGAFIQCSKSDDAVVQEKIVPVKTAAVQQATISLPIHGSGILYSKQQIRLSFKTGGIVQKINANEGENVKRGEILAQLNLAEINAQVAQAESGYDMAQRDFDRVQALYTDSVATLEQLQNVQTQLDVAASRLEIAKFNLDYSTIKAPSDGKILKRFVEPNELVGAGTPIFYFGSGHQAWLIRVGVSDRDIVTIKLGDHARISFDAYPGIFFSGMVTEVAQAADPQNGTFEVEIQFDALDKKLAAGFVANVSITPQQQQNYTLAPIAAIVEAQDSDAYVYTVQIDQAKKLAISIGEIVGEQIIVHSGLENVQQVITEGSPYLRDGDKVRVKN